MPSIFLASSNYPPYPPAGVSRPYSADVERLYSVAEDAAQESPASSRQHSRKSHRRSAQSNIISEFFISCVTLYTIQTYFMSIQYKIVLYMSPGPVSGAADSLHPLGLYPIYP